MIALLQNIPEETALERLWLLIKNHSSLPKITTISENITVNLVLLRLEIYLQLKEKICRQIRGAFIGLLVLRLLAEAFTKHLWIRCMHGTLVVLKKSELDEFHKHLNTLFPGISFTCKEERDCWMLWSWSKPTDAYMRQSNKNQQQLTVYWILTGIMENTT